ncbi:phosphotransferase [Glaciihabitans sp. INWT7]|nr:phosphotransferase [Glaciihabitans sp. INWT7]
MSMHSPCTIPAVFAQRVLWSAVRIFGSRVLPGVRGVWDEPIARDTWDQFEAEWFETFGWWDRVSLYRRPQVSRSGCSLLLLRDGRGVGFVRITSEAERATQEFAVMSSVWSAHPESFVIARPVGIGHGPGWSWIGTESVPNYPLGAVRRAAVRERVVGEMGDVLETALSRSDSTPPTWRGSHGDFAPWNLRTELGGRVRVIDWEDAVFAPPGADLLYGAVTAHLTFGTALPQEADGEVVRWIESAVQNRLASDESLDSLNNRMLVILRGLELRL